VVKIKAENTGQVQSLSRAFSLLERLADSDVGLTLGDIASGADLAPSTAHRLLNSLLQMGYVEVDEPRGLWSIGLKAFTVGNAYLKKRDFIAQARPFMKALVAETGETCNLALLDGKGIVFVGQVECTETMRMVVQLGSRGPVHASGVGKALLAALPEKEALAIAKTSGMAKLTDRTLTSIKKLAGELKSIRERGYAIDDEEQSTGLRCIAANIRDEFGDPLAALSISGPTVRVTKDRVGELGASVRAAAEAITQAIGGKTN